MTELEQQIMKQLEPGWGASANTLKDMLAEDGITASPHDIAGAITCLCHKKLVKRCEDGASRTVACPR